MFISNALQELDVAATETKASIEQCKVKLDFFEQRLAKIMQTRQAMSAIEDINLSVDPTMMDAKPKKAKANKEPAKATKSDDGLPHTKSEFWLGLITTAPQKTADILDAACKALNITDKDLRVKLKQRQTFNLQKFIDTGKIKSEGEQQNRTYFL